MNIAKVSGRIELACKNKKKNSQYLLLLKEATVMIGESTEEHETLWLPFNRKFFLNGAFSNQGEKVILQATYSIRKKDSARFFNDIVDFYDSPESSITSIKTHLNHLLADKVVESDIKEGDVMFRFEDFEPHKAYSFEPGFDLMIITKTNVFDKSLEAKGYIHGIYDWFEIESDLEAKRVYRFNSTQEFATFVETINQYDWEDYIDFYNGIFER